MEAALAAAARAAQAAAAAAARWAHVSARTFLTPKLVLAVACSICVKRLCRCCKDLTPVALPLRPPCRRRLLATSNVRGQGQLSWLAQQHAPTAPSSALFCAAEGSCGSTRVKSAVNQAAWPLTSRPWPPPVLSLVQTSLARMRRVWWWTTPTSCRPAAAASTS